MERRTVAANNPWATKFGYARAVRIGPYVAVSQTAAADEQGRIQGGSDPYQQAVIALQKVEAALKELGASLRDVVRTRVYLARLSDWELVAPAHLAAFGEHPPALSLITIPMVSPEILVEFEVDAVVP